MPTRVRSYSKINLGLAIGPPRPDGFHSLATLYQTIALHDLVTVCAEPSSATAITITTNDARVPTDSRNTVWKMIEKSLGQLHIAARVTVHIQKNLPIQGGMGAGSANAAAALIGLEKELGLDLPQDLRLDLAAQVGSDVPLFLLGGSVLGTDRGQIVAAVPDVSLAGETAIPCVIALPSIGVSTPARLSRVGPPFRQPHKRANRRGFAQFTDSRYSKRVEPYVCVCLPQGNKQQVRRLRYLSRPGFCDFAGTPANPEPP